MKIHITAEMNDQLAIIGGFKTEHRGLIDVKVIFVFFSVFVFQIEKSIYFRFICSIEIEGADNFFADEIQEAETKNY